MIGAIRFHGNGRAKLEPVQAPVHPAPGHVLGRTLYSLTSPGTELNYGFLPPQERPVPTGYASVFRVEETGEGVAAVQPGDIALCMGPHQSFQHAAESDVVPVPSGLDPAVAAIARLMNIGMTALMTTKARPGDQVLVTGAGPVGFLSAALFQRCGFKVMLCDPDANRLQAAEKAGIQRVSETIPEHDSEWRDHVSLVLECSGNEAAVSAGCRVVRKGGEVVLAGVPWKRYTELSAHELLSLVFHRYVVLRSGWEWELPRHPQDFRPHSTFANFATLLRWLSEGMIDASPLMRKASPREAQSVYEGLAERRFGELFVLFDWTLLEVD